MFHIGVSFVKLAFEKFRQKTIDLSIIKTINSTVSIFNTFSSFANLNDRKYKKIFSFCPVINNY